MASKYDSPLESTLKKINKILVDYKAVDIKADMKAIEPKDRLSFFLKMTEILVQNKDFLKTASQRRKEITHTIDFVD